MFLGVALALALMSLMTHVRLNFGLPGVLLNVFDALPLIP